MEVYQSSYNKNNISNNSFNNSKSISENNI